MKHIKEEEGEKKTKSWNWSEKAWNRGKKGKV